MQHPLAGMPRQFLAKGLRPATELDVIAHPKSQLADQCSDQLHRLEQPAHFYKYLAPLMFSVERLVLQPHGPDESFVRGEHMDHVRNRVSEGTMTR
jgi:hypothetical protein